MATASRLKKLRLLMSQLQYVPESLAAYVIFTEDSHQSEYIADSDKRRQFISGFTGSAGTAVVTCNQALLWTDSRYFLQASKQLDPFWTLMKAGRPGTPSIPSWLKKLRSGSAVGFDPMLCPEVLHKKWMEELEGSGVHLVPVRRNLVDLVWEDRPSQPAQPVFPHPVSLCGQPWQEKVVSLREKMKEEGAVALVVTALDEIAWLFNLRGSDIAYNPVFFGYAIITNDEAKLFMNSDRLTSEAQLQLASGGVQQFAYEEVANHITVLLQTSEGAVWINSQSSYGLCSLIPAARRVRKLSPIQLMKAIKNPVEIEGMKQAHIKDAVALCQFFAWLQGKMNLGHYVTEISAANELESFRRQQSGFFSLSFPTISASGPHGAIIHYCPTVDSDRPLSVDEIYLCDSGSQFRDGTTDVTRTFHFGTPTSKQKEAYTCVLKGHIALACAIFPNKTVGSRLDSFARASLWQVGLDYSHGTGHGVGAFLNVHEGPQGIGGSRPSAEPIQASMILSNEPGFYEEGEFGIRIENLVIVKPVNTPYNHDGVQYLTMETITLVPIQLKMVVPEMLNEQEISWINDYHTQCREIVGAALLEQDLQAAHQWLVKETQLLG